MAAGQIGARKGFGDERYKRLITALVKARLDQRVSQSALAKRLGQVQQFVSRYETGERRLDVVEYVDVARELGVDPVAVLMTLPMIRAKAD